MAPPPPPGTFTPPLPEFIYGLDPDLRNLQPPPMAAPNPPSAFPSMEEEDFSFLQPPLMAAPRPPSICSSGSSTLSASSLPSDLVPEHPKFAAPSPPSERHPKVKMPPPKPIRLSSMSTYDSPPPTPAPPPPVQKPTPSSFNPQNTAKLYDVPKTSILSRLEDRSPKPKQLLLLEDSGSVRSTPVLVQVNGKAPKLAPPAPPVSKEGKKQFLNMNQGSPSPAPEPKKEIKSKILGPDRPFQTQPLQKVTNTLLSSSKDQPAGPPSHTGKFSPLLDHKLRNLKGSESSTSREASAASPLSLLMAAKERDKHKLSQGNSFSVKPRSGLTFLTSKSIREETSKFSAAVENAQKPTIWQTPGPAAVEERAHSSSINGTAEPSPAATRQQLPEANHEDSEEEFSMPLLPPPAEFGDPDWLMEPPPELLPPDPPRKPPQLARPPLKPKPPQAPQLPPPLQTKVEPKAPPPLPSPLSPSQATLLSILQKKMLEMDHKMAPAKDPESGFDDWNSSLSDEDNAPPVFFPKAASQSKNTPGVSQDGLDLQELEDKVSNR